MWKAFHHPDISLPVVTRSATEFFLEMLGAYGEFCRSPLHWYLSPDAYESRAGYDHALQRLRQRGLLVSPGRRAASPPVLTVTTKAKDLAAAIHRPEKAWRRRWNGIWYVLVYDVPEKERGYRNSLRLFLRQMRLGCLQGSVWVTPEDIRPQYNDLTKAAAVGGYAFLFEARTVLGQPAADVVRQAWDWDRLGQIQRCYLEIYAENLRRALTKRATLRQRAELLEAEWQAYRAALTEDPLLPQTLWPADYAGPQVAALHRQLLDALAS